MGKRPKQTFLQRRHTDGYQTHEKMLNVIHYSVQFSHSVVSDSLQPRGLQHTRPPCPSLTPGACSNSYLLSWWCHPTISSSHSLLEKCKSKLQWYTTSHQSESSDGTRPSSKSLQTINSWESVEKREHSCTVGGNVNWYSHWQYGDFLKKTMNKTTIWPSNPTPSYIPWGNQNWKRHMYPIVRGSTIYNS